MFGNWLSEQAISSPDQVGLVYKNQAWNYRAMNELVEQATANLAAAGVHPGQAVGVLLPNCPEFVLLVHAAARLGAILAPLNLRLTPVELSWQVKQSKCAFLVAGAQTLMTVEMMDGEGLIFLDCSSLVPDLDINHAFEISTQGHSEKLSPDHVDLDLSRVQAIIFTSGTTGQPKGACLTFGNHFWSAMASAYRLGIQLGDRWLAPLPLYHVGGLALVFRCALYGAALVLQETATAQAILETIRTEKITGISLVPTMLQRLLDLPGAAAVLASLRCILLGGAPANAQLLERSLAAGLNLALTYGMTETASQIATATPEQTRRKPGSVGKPLLFSRVRILDETGQELTAGQIGSIAVSGPTLMKGYYQPPAPGDLQSESAEQEAPSNQTQIEEFITGDLGYLDEESDLWIVQRRVDLIISGGENIYPAEVETALQAHPDVLSACIVGLPDSEWGQQVVGAVVLGKDGQVNEAGLIDFCRLRLAGYKTPRRILFVDHLPMTESGKILRSQVVELFSIPQQDFLSLQQETHKS